MEKLLTVSIAAYNIGKYIDRTLLSCLVSEEYQKLLEVLIVNDGSTDNTLEIASKYVNDYPEIFKIIDKKNGGYGSTINSAIKIAAGKYFRLLDGDDWYDTKELEKILEELKQVEADLVLNDFTICYDNTGRKNEVKLLIDKEGQVCDIKDLSMWDNVAMYSFCYKTDLLKKNNIHFTENCFYTDIEYIVNPLVFVKNYLYASKNLYQYRLGVKGQSVSFNGMKKHHKDALYIMKETMEMSKQERISPNIKEIIESISAMMVKRALKSEMCAEVSCENRKALLQKDRMIKERYPEVYERTNTLLFKILRMTDYWVYPVWTVIMLAKEKIYG